MIPYSHLNANRELELWYRTQTRVTHHNVSLCKQAATTIHKQTYRLLLFTTLVAGFTEIFRWWWHRSSSEPIKPTTSVGLGVTRSADGRGRRTRNKSITGRPSNRPVRSLTAHASQTSVSVDPESDRQPRNEMGGKNGEGRWTGTDVGRSPWSTDQINTN